MKNLIIFTLALLTSASAAAQLENLGNKNLAPATTVSPGPKVIIKKKVVSKGPQVLDFEAEVIEGEKRRPDFFLDIAVSEKQLGTILYIRPNFDDFIGIDKDRRTQFKRVK